MCNENKIISFLSPDSLRLPTLTNKDEVKKASSVPEFYFDDQQMDNSYPEIYEKMSLADVRYYWAFLKIFNQYLAEAVPYINNSQSISQIPSDSVAMTMSAYMSFIRNLCLQHVKIDLRHLILEKTAVNREACPKLFFERLKLAHKNKENEDSET